MKQRNKVAAILSRPWAIVVIVAIPVLAAAAWFLLKSADTSGQGFISESEFVSARIGESQSVVQSRLGTPLASSDVPDVLPVPSGGSCVYYQDEVPTIDGTIYRLCFRNKVLILKDGYGPLFDSPPLSSATPSA